MTITELVAALETVLQQWRSYGCPICHGDCASANPPVTGCLMQETETALAAVRAIRARGAG